MAETIWIGDRLPRRAHRAQALRERLAGHVVHDEQQLARLRHDVERGHDVGVADARGQAGLVDEHRDEVGIERELRRAGA